MCSLISPMKKRDENHECVPHNSPRLVELGEPPTTRREVSLAYKRDSNGGYDVGDQSPPFRSEWGVSTRRNPAFGD